MPLFLFYFPYFKTYIHSFNQILTIHLFIAICWGLSPFPHCLYAQWETPPCGAEPRIELGPVLQQADALLTEPRRTILSHAAPCWATPHHTEPCRTMLSHAAPYWATPHHTEPRRTINSWITNTLDFIVLEQIHSIFFYSIVDWRMH